MRVSPAAIAAAFALGACALGLRELRHVWIDAITTADATPTLPVTLPGGDAKPGLPPVPLTRVVLIDGLTADAAHAMPAWTALCERGARLTVDVGFPTVSLPVEFALWSGLTQQQTGVVDNGDEKARPPPARGIPAQIANSWAIAEDHGFIVASLGFARTESGETPSWQATFPARAQDAVASDRALVFVHVLRVDHAGHLHGAASPEYAASAASADAVLAALVAARPDARWFALSDHGHLASGGHGGEEREVRQVEGCIAGPGLAPNTAGPVHVVDVARAIADSTGARLSDASPARSFGLAMTAPLDGDAAVPGVDPARGALAAIVLAIGLAGAACGVRRWWLAPWWIAIACASLVLVRGEPTLSTPMTYAPAGRAMYETWLPALLACAAATWFGVRRTTTLARTLLAQLALPVAMLAAAITLCGGWPTLLGAESAPVVPRYTAWVSALMLMLAHGLAVTAVVSVIAVARLNRRDAA